MMQHPFQYVLLLPPTTSESGTSERLVGACGPHILSLSLQHGTIRGQWTADVLGAASSNTTNGVDGSERPTKKQKTIDSSSNAPSITRLARSPDHQYIVAVTDDKCIHVLQVQYDGQLNGLSQRCMPKRPCAIEVMPDNATILCGDKFGDVYSLPLLPVETEDDNTTPLEKTRPQDTNFKPSATNLTIHTQRNRKALEAQMKQKNFTPRKESLKFQHQLLLGHVSMLTDVKCTVRSVDDKTRSYIITADRDEHIRISRGPPQAHIIEGYCLGHTEFISKICPIPDTDLLISGGGDTWLGVWNWPASELLQKLDLNELLRMQTDYVDPREDIQPVVSGLSTMEIKADAGYEQVLVISLEKVKAVWLITRSALVMGPLQDNGILLEMPKRCTCVMLPAHPLDTTSVCGTMIVSLDARDPGSKRLQAYQVREKDRRDPGDPTMVTVVSVEDDGLSSGLQAANAFSGPGTTKGKLDELLYGIAEMRKRRDQNEGEAETAEDAAPDPEAELEA